MYTFRKVIADREEDLQRALKEGAWIVDVRTPEEFKDGHFPDAVNIPMMTVPKRIQEFTERGKEIIVYCHSGQRSAQVKNFLIQNGVVDVLNGGNTDYLTTLKS